jgi:phosphoribosyl-dephospho-CoA transferase
LSVVARRHDWVYLREGTVVALAHEPAREWVAQWLAAGRPLVATRQHVPEGEVALGIALPRALGAHRIPCVAPASGVVRVRNPVTVEEAIEVLAPAEAAALQRLAGAIAGHALQLGVYGSTAWEYFAGGGGHRHPHSDVDVICDVASGAGWSACLAAFADGERYFPSRLDGEIRVAGRAVAWRELRDACRDGPDVVLAKGEREVSLLALQHVLSALR